MQKKLSQKAEKEPEHQFENLYGLLCNEVWLRMAAHKTLRGCLKSLHGFLQRYPHAMVIVDFRELRTIVTSSEAALHQLKTLMSGLFKQPLRRPVCLAFLLA